MTNLCKWLDITLLQVNDEWDQLSDLAGMLLHKRRFIFKGGEPPGEVSLWSIAYYAYNINSN